MSTPLLLGSILVGLRLDLRGEAVSSSGLLAENAVLEVDVSQYIIETMDKGCSSPLVTGAWRHPPW